MVGRKRHLVVDTDGRLVGMDVHDADLQDPNAGKDLLEVTKQEHPELELIWADGRYRDSFVRFAREELGIAVEIVTRAPDAQGFVLAVRRRVIERTFSWLLTCRGLVRDSEELVESSKAWIYLAMTRLYLRHLARFAY